MGFEEWVVGLSVSVVEINSNFKHFGYVSDHIDKFYLNKFALIDVEIKKFRELRKINFLFVVKSKTIFLTEKSTVEVIIIWKSLVVILAVRKKT